jgi:hypothetical protein
MVGRVESLNLAGEMLWMLPLSLNFNAFPLSRYDWLTVTADVFLMRYISVADCALLLVNEVYEKGLERHNCTLGRLRRSGIPDEIEHVFAKIISDQAALRMERNARVHHGEEGTFTQDDLTFKMAAMYERRGSGLDGADRFGRKIDLERMLKEGLVELQRKFNRSTRMLVRQLDVLYEVLWAEFEARFGPRIAAATHGLSANQACP